MNEQFDEQEESRHVSLTVSALTRTPGGLTKSAVVTSAPFCMEQ